jgi:hypothetical protein
VEYFLEEELTEKVLIAWPPGAPIWHLFILLTLFKELCLRCEYPDLSRFKGIIRLAAGQVSRDILHRL